MTVPMKRVCNWNITHSEDLNMTPRIKGAVQVTHGICKPCQEVVRADIRARCVWPVRS